MRKLNYKRFNLICLSLLVFFILGTVWVWRGELWPVRIEGVENVPVVEKNIETKIEIGDAGAEKKTIEEEKTAEEDQLIPRFNLNVPFTPQAPEREWGDPWQNACEEAAALMLDAYYKGYNLSPLFAKDEILKIIKWEEEKGWHTSIPIEKVKVMIEEYFKISNFKFQISNFSILENPTVEDIKRSIVNGNPVLVVAYGKDLPNPHYRNDGPEYHALIIRGYTEEKFITNDPGTQFGKNYSYYYEDLMNAIHDWNNGDVKNGRKVMLVIDF